MSSSAERTFCVKEQEEVRVADLDVTPLASPVITDAWISFVVKLLVSPYESAPFFRTRAF